MNKKLHIYILLQLIMINYQYPIATAQVISNNGAALSISPGANISNVSNVVNTSGSIANDGVITITSDVTNNATITGNGTYNIGGNFTNNSIFVAGSGAVNMNGAIIQTIDGSSSSTFNNLSVNNNNGVSLATNTAISGTLNFISGVVNTGVNKISITSSGSVTGAGTSKFVNGNLEKFIPAGASIPVNFEIGNGSADYLPLNLNFASVTGSGNFTAKANNGDHSDIVNSCLDPTKSVNRNWTLTNTGTVFTNYSANANYLTTDKDPASNSANYFMAIKNAGVWSILSQGSLTATSTQGVGITIDGDLQIGEKKLVGTPIFAIGSTSQRCRIAEVVSYSATASNATSILYSLDAASITAGNTINAATGDVNYTASYVGTSTITATAAGCNGSKFATHVAVSTYLPVNSATISGVGCVAIGATQTYSITAVSRASSYVWTVPTGATILTGQGTNSITVNFSAGLVNGFVTVNPQNVCGSAVSTSKKDVGAGGIPTMPGAVTGPTMVCQYIGSGVATYSITPVTGASSYLWASPTGATIASGQGTNLITVSFNTSIVSGQFSVNSVNGCGTSAFDYFNVSKVGYAPVSITGIANAYGKTDNISQVNYTTPVVSGASSYNWTVPANVTIASGQGTTSVYLKFAPAFTGGNIGVATVTSCGNSAIKTKAIANNTTTPLSSLEQVISKKNVSCYGQNDGKATVTIEGGSPPYTYVWNTSPIQTSATAVNLTAGTYKVKVVDNLGNSFIEEVTIDEPSELKANVLKIKNSLYDEATGSAIASVSGGTGIYNYSWNTSPVQNTQEIVDLAAGSYVVTVKDENNCISQSEIVISDSLVNVNAFITTKVYPVPAKNKFTIEYNLINDIAYSLTVISYDGKTILNSLISESSSSQIMSIDCASWSRGMYFVIVKDINNNILSSKPIVLVDF